MNTILKELKKQELAVRNLDFHNYSNISFEIRVVLEKLGNSQLYADYFMLNIISTNGTLGRPVRDISNYVKSSEKKKNEVVIEARNSLRENIEQLIESVVVYMEENNIEII